ncbi:MAG: hypothetical protein M1503_09820 [Thaumarchaeota archaeon]|nr:hypothetical protein [Nitrososphaerota archaeon]MCL5318537.1 hypothetical protein [Nitrososphaerota archaeon]
MNYLPSRIVPGNTVHKATSLAITAIMVTAMFVGLIPIVPAYAANQYLSVGSSNIKTGTNGNIVQITIHDTSLTTHPTVSITVGSTTTPLNTYRTAIGDWLVFVKDTGSSATLSTNPTTNASATPNSIAFGTATTSTITYSERGETSTLTVGATTPSSLVSDRSPIPVNAKIRVTFKDQTANVDPTLANTPSYSVTAQINGAANGTATSTISATETGLNTGNFTLSFDLAKLVPTPARGDIVSVVINGSTALDVPVTAYNGIISAPSPITYGQPINITLTDQDRNVDTAVQETLSFSTVKVVGVVVGATTVTKTGNLTLKETGKNTGIFTGTVTLSIASGTTPDVSGNMTTGLTFSIPVGQTASFSATYKDPYPVTAGYQSQTTFNLALTAPTIATDQTSYIPASSIPATITLTNPNANDDANAIERLTLANNTKSWLDVTHATATAAIGKLNVTETKSGVTRTLTFTTVPTQFVESGRGTGVFNLNLDLATNLNGSRTAGSTLTVKYYDLFTKTTITTTVTIGGTVSTVSLDRTTLPVSLGNAVSVVVSVTDPKANTNAFGIDSANIKLIVYNATNQRVSLATSSSVTVPLTETGINTGIFTATVTYNIASGTGTVTVNANSVDYILRNVNLTSMAPGANVKGQQMVNGKLVFGYTDPLATGGNVTATGTIKPSTAALTVSPVSVGLNGSLTVSLTEPDEDLSTTSKSQPHVNIFKGTSQVGSLTLKETGNNTGVFTASKRVGSGAEAPFLGFAPGDTITVKYIDNATATSYYGTGLTTSTLTGTATIPTSSATMKLSAASYGPSSTVKVTVTDADLVFNASSTVTLARVQTSKLVVTDMRANTTYSNGTFTWTFKLGGTGLTTATVDTLSVYFVDKVDAAGNVGVILSATAPIVSTTGSITVTPATVVVGQYLNVTVTDLDKNTDPNVVQSVTVMVTSTSWPIGQNITLPETAPNTGVFSAQVQVVAGLPAAGSNQIRGATGDTVTATFSDDINATGKASSVSATAMVGTSQVPTQRVPASTPSLVSSTGQPVTAPTAGSLVVVQAAVKNNASTTQTFTYIVQVKNANGQVVFLNWIQNMTLSAGQTSTPGISWTPSAAGTYTIQVFVWNTLTGAVAYSPVVSQTVTVS